MGRHQIEHTLTEKVIMETYSSHPFILGLKDSFQTPEFVCLVSDFASGGELYFHMDKNGAMLENAARFYTAQVCDAIIFLHKRNVLVRDLKAENLLLGADGNVLVADFGLSKCGVSAFK